jgi:hypothetical protein
MGGIYGVAIEMGSGTIIYTGIQKLIGGVINRQTDRMEIA